MFRWHTQDFCAIQADKFLEEKRRRGWTPDQVYQVLVEASSVWLPEERR